MDCAFRRNIIFLLRRKSETMTGRDYGKNTFGDVHVFVPQVGGTKIDLSKFVLNCRALRVSELALCRRRSGVRA